jgi:hypothetical protein
MTEQADPAATDTPVGWELSQEYLQPNTTMQNLYIISLAGQYL